MSEQVHESASVAVDMGAGDVVVVDDNDALPDDQPQARVAKPSPALRVQFADRPEELPLLSADLEVQVSGLYFSVVQTVTFLNPHDKELEGSLNVPLPDGAVVSGFATTVDGPEAGLVHATIVAKEKARVAFETEVRKGGPAAAIMEHVAGNAYRTRVFPLHANSPHTVQISFHCAINPVSCISKESVEATQPPAAVAAIEIIRTSVLSWLDGNAVAGLAVTCRYFRDAIRHATVRLPTDWLPHREADVRVSFASPIEDGDATEGADEGAAVTLIPNERGELVVFVPTLLGKEAIAFAEPRPATEDGDDDPVEIASTTDSDDCDEDLDDSDHFFILLDAPAFPQGGISSVPLNPKRVGIAWDSSFSRVCRNSNIQREIETVEAILKALNDDTEVQLFRFSSSVSEIGSCRTLKGNGRLSLVEDLESVVYDGGSVSIGDECSILRETAGIDVWFVFGDGLDNLTALPSSKKHGSTDSVPFQVPVHYLTSSAEADFDALRRGANASAGGLFIDLRHVVPDEVARRTTMVQFGCRGITAVGAENSVTRMFPPNGRAALVPGQRHRVVGKMKGLQVQVEVEYGPIGGHATDTSVFTRRYTISALRGGGGNVAREWARHRIAGAGDDDKLALALGRQFGIVVANSSLMVLSTLQQHLDHGVRPSASRASLRAQYDAHRSRLEQSNEAELQDKLESVWSMWNTRVERWRQTEKPFVAPFHQPFSLQVVALGTSAGISLSFDHTKPLTKKTSQRARAKYGYQFVLTKADAPDRKWMVRDHNAGTVLWQMAQLAGPGEYIATIAATRRTKTGTLAVAGAPSKPQTVVLSAETFAAWKAEEEARVAAQRAELEAQQRTSKKQVSRMKEDKSDNRSIVRVGDEEIELELRVNEDALCEAVYAPPPPQAFSAASRNCERRARASDAELNMHRAQASNADLEDCCDDDDEDDDDDDDNGLEGTAQTQGAAPGTIKLAGWNPQTPYMNTIKEAVESASTDAWDAAYLAYLAERASYFSAPSFFLDVASYFFDQAKRDEQSPWFSYGLRICTSVLDMGTDDAGLLRIVGYMLKVQQCHRQAEAVFARVLKLRPEEPQSFRDYALVLSSKVKSEFASCRANTPKQLTEADGEALVKCAWKVIDLYDTVVTKKWDSRFKEIEVTALTERNGFLAHCRAIADLVPEIEYQVVDRAASTLPGRLQTTLDFDLRISLAWDTDMTDIDLHVLEPSGEKAYYGNRRTEIGGQVSRDFTQGYGPEEYTLRAACSGNYKVSAKYYSNSRQDMAGATTLLLTLCTNYGRPGREQFQDIALRLSGNKDIVQVGEINVP